MKTTKRPCSFNTFDKRNRASLAAKAKNESSEMRHLAILYRMYARHANQEVKTLSEDYDEAISLLIEFKEHAEAREKDLTIKREMDVLRMQLDALGTKLHTLQMKQAELNTQFARL